MKKLSALFALSLVMAVPSFAAEHIVGRSAKLVGKESYKTAAFSAKEGGKAGKKVLGFVF